MHLVVLASKASGVPLWAFLVASIAGPIVGAALTVLGTLLNNRYNAKENQKSREFQRTSEFNKWRNDQRTQVYSDLIQLVTDTYVATNPSRGKDLEGIKALNLRVNILYASVKLHGSEGVQ